MEFQILLEKNEKIFAKIFAGILKLLTNLTKRYDRTVQTKPGESVTLIVI